MMTTMQKNFDALCDRADRKAEQLNDHHPYLVSSALFIAGPMMILAAITAVTTLAALPIAWFSGCL